LNTLLAELVRSEKNVEFIDLFPAFLDDQGQPVRSSSSKMAPTSARRVVRR
jgi:hypothetical protein